MPARIRNSTKYAARLANRFLAVTRRVTTAPTRFGAQLPHLSFAIIFHLALLLLQARDVGG
jgi:hypothetical protein